jgi:hypothetical protein
MNPSQRPYLQLQIPPLCGDSALLVVNLLDRIIHAIWQLHGEAMIEILNDVHASPHRDPVPDPLADADLPF